MCNTMIIIVHDKARVSSDLVVGGIQDELCSDPVVLWRAVVEQGVGQVGHAFTAQTLSTAEEHCILGGGEDRQSITV